MRIGALSARHFSAVVAHFIDEYRLPIDAQTQAFVDACLRTDLELARPLGRVALDEQSRYAGCLIAMRDPFHGPRSFGIRSIQVLPSCQGQGLGRALLASALEEARRIGFESVHLLAQPGRGEALRWYRRMGFAPTGWDEYTAAVGPLAARLSDTIGAGPP